MKRIGVIPADRLPSSSIGLRLMEFTRLGFSRSVAYTAVRATASRMYSGLLVARTPSELLNSVDGMLGGDVVFVNGSYRLDDDAMKALGTPGPNEIRCLAGKLFGDRSPLGDRTLVNVMEYDRRRNVARYARSDDGDVRVDAVDLRGPVAMTVSAFRTLMASGDEWVRTVGAFQDAAETAGLRVVCMDPMKHGVRWHSGVIAGEKKPTKLVVRGSFQPRRQEDGFVQAPSDARTVLSDVVVSMSTYRARFPVLDTSLGSIFAQTVRPWRICVVVDDVDIPYISGYLKERVENGDVELLVGDKSLGPHNKYVHAMRKYPDKCVVTFDDDADYRRDALEELHALHLKYPGCVCTRRAHLITYDESGAPLPYRRWVNQCTAVRYPSFDLFATGVGGILYPANAFSWTDDDIERMKGFRNDDLFMKKVENDLGIRVATTGTRPDADPRIKRNGAQDTALLHFNVNGGNNDAETARLGIRRMEARRHGSTFFRIVIPVYKSTRTLARAIDSIRSQSFDDYVVCVCDDGSPEEMAEENKRTVESLGRKGVFVRNETNMFAGGARNRAMEECRESEYTLFLDADDTFAYPNLFRELHDLIESVGYPDLVLLPFFRRNGESNVAETSRLTTPEKLATDRRYEVPWCKCIRTEIVKPFQEGLRRTNDVLQHYLTIDSISSVVPFHREAVQYRGDSDTTMFGPAGAKNRKQKGAFTSYLKCIVGLIEHEWVHDYAKEGALTEANFILTNSIPSFLRSIGASGIREMMEIGR